MMIGAIIMCICLETTTITKRSEHSLELFGAGTLQYGYQYYEIQDHAIVRPYVYILRVVYPDDFQWDSCLPIVLEPYAILSAILALTDYVRSIEDSRNAFSQT